MLELVFFRVDINTKCDDTLNIKTVSVYTKSDSYLKTITFPLLSKSYQRSGYQSK